jgi:ribosomal protein S18 acetylase RimI-like enzyme
VAGTPTFFAYPRAELSSATGAVGLVAVRADATDPRVAWLLSMWVASEARRSGAAGALLSAAAAHAATEGQTLRLRVFDTNAAARRLYERFGFTITGRATVADGRVELEMALGSG